MRAAWNPGGSADTSTQSVIRASSLWSHCWKENHIADVRGTRQVHEQPVDTDTYTTHGRHAVFHGAQIILIYLGRLFIARRAQLGLRLEAPPLVQWIIQLAEGVCHLLPVREQLEPLR